MNKKVLAVNVLVLSMAGAAVFLYFTMYEPVTAINNTCLELVNGEAFEAEHDWSAFGESWEKLNCDQVMDKTEMIERINNREAMFGSVEMLKP